MPDAGGQVGRAGGIVVSLARAVGGSIVSVRVDGGIDTVLEARIDTMLDLL